MDTIMNEWLHSLLQGNVICSTSKKQHLTLFAECKISVVVLPGSGPRRKTTNSLFRFSSCIGIFLEKGANLTELAVQVFSAATSQLLNGAEFVEPGGGERALKVLTHNIM